MQNEITEKIIVPNEKGLIENPGWCRQELMEYSRKNIKATWLRKKEWDYYMFANDKFAVAFTISDLGYGGLLSCSFIDLVEGTEHTETDFEFFTFNKKYGLGVTVNDVNGECNTKRLHLKYSGSHSKRHISCLFKNFDGEKNLTVELDVYERMEEAMYIATPWKEKPTAFYLNCKHNCLEAEGVVTYGDRVEKVERDSFCGCLDWGRGVWTYKNTWYWGTCSTKINGNSFGLNLGYGFSDRSKVSENCIYYKDKVHKLDVVDFVIPEDEKGNKQFTKHWKITSNDGRLLCTFEPILDRRAKINLLLIRSDQHQVFGKLNGYCILDSGEKIDINNVIAAVEVIKNVY